MTLPITRRNLLIGAGSLAAATGFSGIAQAQGTVVTRRDVATMAPNDPDLEAYRIAVWSMKRGRRLDGSLLPSSLQWLSQANIHQNRCPHGNWYFLPWHRAYVSAFEAICRDLSGKADFALPYWNWSNPKSRAIPAPFWEQTWRAPTGDIIENPLLNRTRGVTSSTPMPWQTDQSNIDRILKERLFEVFASMRPRGQNSTAPSWQRVNGATGEFEGQPHNEVHVTIGGDMVTFRSPLDPIFWLHHCNIDRIWAIWNASGKVNTVDALWRDFTFVDNFVRPDGSPFNITVKDVNSIGTMANPYRYDDVGERSMPQSALIAAATTSPIDGSRVLARQKLTGRNLLASSTASFAMVTDSLPALTANAAQADGVRTLAIVRDVVPPTDPSTEVRVFLGDEVSPDTGTDDPRFVGSFSFFGSDHAGHGGGRPSYLFDLTDELAAQRAAGNVGEKIALSLVPVADQPVTLKTGGIDIISR